MNDMHTTDGLGATDYDAWYKGIRNVLISYGMNVHVEHSPVSDSPYRHMYVWLSDDKFEGPYLHISQAAELEDKHGYYACRRDNADDVSHDAHYIDSAIEVTKWAMNHHG